jgi:hypothetical protein
VTTGGAADGLCAAAAGVANSEFATTGSVAINGETCTWRSSAGQLVELSVIAQPRAPAYYNAAATRATDKTTVAGRPAVWVAPHQLVVLSTSRVFVVAVPGAPDTLGQRDHVAQLIATALVKSEA